MSIFAASTVIEMCFDRTHDENNIKKMAFMLNMGGFVFLLVAAGILQDSEEYIYNIEAGFWIAGGLFTALAQIILSAYLYRVVTPPALIISSLLAAMGSIMYFLAGVMGLSQIVQKQLQSSLSYIVIEEGPSSAADEDITPCNYLFDSGAVFFDKKVYSSLLEDYRSSNCREEEIRIVQDEMATIVAREANIFIAGSLFYILHSLVLIAFSYTFAFHKEKKQHSAAVAKGSDAGVMAQ